MVHTHCALRELRNAKRSIAHNRERGFHLHARWCWIERSASSADPFDMRRASCLSSSFGNPAARGNSGRACGFVSHAFAWFTLVETESVSTFSSFAGGAHHLRVNVHSCTCKSACIATMY